VLADVWLRLRTGVRGRG